MRIAFLPITPLLIPEIAVGAAAELDNLRGAAREATDWVCADARSVGVLVPGTATTSGEQWSLQGYGLTVGHGPPVPLAVAVARWLLDGRPADVHGSEDHGADLSGHDGLLVMGDGSAARTDKAPGHFHPGAVDFDTQVLVAIGVGDAPALAGLDLSKGAEVLAAGVPAWQRLGRMVGKVTSSAVDAQEDRYGVLYFVARWTAAWAAPA